MVKMNEVSKKFMEKNLPESLRKEDIEEVLRDLYDLINEKGFAPPNFEDYNDFGREAQKVYDDIYFSDDE